jgi:hypothetical protein
VASSEASITAMFFIFIFVFDVWILIYSKFDVSMRIFLFVRAYYNLMRHKQTSAALPLRDKLTKCAQMELSPVCN